MSDTTPTLGKPFCSISNSSTTTPNSTWMDNNNNIWVGDPPDQWQDQWIGSTPSGGTGITGAYTPPQIVTGWPPAPAGNFVRREPTEEELKDPVFADLWDKFKFDSRISADHILKILEVVKPYFDALEEANRILAHPKKEVKTEEDELREQMI
jgi:hypothetical protein